jgi:hypothetical protein
MSRRIVLAVGALALIGLLYGFAHRLTPAPSAEIADTPAEITAQEMSKPSFSPASSAPGIPLADANLVLARAELTPLLKNASKVPTIASMRGKPASDVHDTPAEVLESGRRFGALAEFLEKNPKLIREALPTYRDCAMKSDAIPSIRSLCTYRLRTYEKEWDAETRAAYQKIPEEIQTLSSRLDGS